jgi:hypothetical protein
MSKQPAKSATYSFTFLHLNFIPQSLRGGEVSIRIRLRSCKR